MSEASQKKSFAPHIGLIAIIALAIILVFVFFPAEEPKPEVTPAPQVIEPEIVAPTESTTPATASMNLKTLRPKKSSYRK